MRVTLILFCFSLLIASCSSAPKVEEKVVVNESMPRPALKVVKREPGSLWSEDSRWNDIYATAPSRVLGDLIKIKLSAEIKKKMNRLSEPVKEGNEKSSQTNTTSQSKGEPDFMEASIIEVLPRGVFAVRALQTVKIGSQETRFELLGNLREKDIDSTDVANSDAILNLSLAASLGGKGYQPIDSLVSALEVAANTPPAATPSANSSPVASAANSSPPATAPSSNASEGGPTNNNNSGDKK